MGKVTSRLKNSTKVDLRGTVFARGNASFNLSNGLRTNFLNNYRGEETDVSWKF